MRKLNIKSPRGSHVAPGVYTQEIDVLYSAKSLGITKLGLVGETLMGPAFQPIPVENWKEYTSTFGGTSPKLFRGSKYPKYELPYIAKEFLTASDNLQIVRVLGLSGVNAGPAFIITGYKSKPTEKEALADYEAGVKDGTYPYTKDNPMVIAVLRSRGEHKKAAFVAPADPDNGICDDVYEYDAIDYYAQNVFMTPSTSFETEDACQPGFVQRTGSFDVNVINYGMFTLKVKIGTDSDGKDIFKMYPVSLNPTDKNYIYNILGSDPEETGAVLFVEELYDIALSRMIETGKIDTLGTVGKDDQMELTTYRPIRYIPKYKDVHDILTFDESTLKRKNVGERYLCSKEMSVNNASYGENNGTPLKVHVYDTEDKTWKQADAEPGHIYTVTAVTDDYGKRQYYYAEFSDKVEILGGFKEKSSYDETFNKDSLQPIFKEAVFVQSQQVFYAFDDTEIFPITLDMNNYKEAFRYASTPWVVSELKGSSEHVELAKLFRFHTISDGGTANTMFKLSIENIEPDEGTFDVKLRDFYDTDSSPVVLERYQKVNLIPGTKNYLGMAIGTTDGKYELKSKYITVEINETDVTQTSIPGGFLGYPLRSYETGVSVGETNVKPQKPEFQYNLSLDDEIKPMKQYFGVSDRTGIDDDILRYKGVEAYNGLPDGLSPSFHLDARIINGTPDGLGYIYEYDATQLAEKRKAENAGGKYTSKPALKQLVTVDGETGYSWATVSKSNMLEHSNNEPRLGSYTDMLDTIYEDKRNRKFTMAFYGGFDGWDYYRTYRSTGDEFQYSRYRGHINKDSGYGSSVNVLQNSADYGIASRALTTDYYAFLAGYMQFSNPKTTDINLFATPGIDYVNSTALVHEVIDMVEENRNDSLYVVTTPDKPLGASDSEFDMYTPHDAVWNLEDTEIDSNYVASYYPWVKYYDQQNSQYIFLPPTKDALRNMATTDNVAFPWFAPTGWNRGIVNAIAPKKKLKLDEQDILYDGRINYINTFAQEGMRLWGDKNFQVADSVMNRISKRRLLLHIKRLCINVGNGLLFDPYDQAVVQSFKSSVSPILDGILTNRGISDWRIEIDYTPENVDRLTMPVRIFIKPINALEYIEISFIITPQSTSFDEL